MTRSCKRKNGEYKKKNNVLKKNINIQYTLKNTNIILYKLVFKQKEKNNSIIILKNSNRRKYNKIRKFINLEENLSESFTKYQFMKIYIYIYIKA